MQSQPSGKRRSLCRQICAPAPGGVVATLRLEIYQQYALDYSAETLTFAVHMKKYVSFSGLNKRFSLAMGLFAAAMVVCTSFFQFHLEPAPVGKVHATFQQEVVKEAAAESESDADKEKAPQTVCTIQAVSQGVQLHVSYEPIIWEFADIELPEFKLEIPGEIYSASWEYFKVLFSNIISPNAP